MALLKIREGSRGIMRLLLIQLLCCFGWFSSFALAQFDISEGVTGSLNFPALGITCVANLAVFVTTLIRGRLDLEMGARDALEILLSTKLKNIKRIKHGNGLTTLDRDLQWASVVMLSNGTPNWSMRQFMKSNAPIVDSIQLQFLRLQDAVIDAKVREELTPEVTIETCECTCNCILFWTAEDITIMLARRMPGTLKELSSSLCLLPCLTCLTNDCHGCNGDSLLRVEGPWPLEQADEEHRLRVSKPKVVSKILDDIGARFINAEEHICICIPMHGASSDVWTELLTVCIVAGSAVAGTLGIKSFGRWVYAVLQILVWLKWAVGSCILNGEISIEFLGRNPESWGMMVYSSAFMLNAVLAGVRCKWEAWPWKDNHLFSRKLGP